VLSVELNPAGVERKAAASSWDAADGVEEVEDVESEHATTVKTTAIAAAMVRESPFMIDFSDQRCLRWPGSRPKTRTPRKPHEGRSGCVLVLFGSVNSRGARSTP
jgi:hypothetical protein